MIQVGLKLQVANAYPRRAERLGASLRAGIGNARIALVNYASGDVFRHCQKNWIETAAALGEFDLLSSWSDRTLRATAFYAENQAILQLRRGDGYWLWKPYIIKDALDHLADGDFLFYSDVGPQTGGRLETSILPICAWLHGHADRMAIGVLPGLWQKTWTKRDCFVYMDCDSARFWNVDQFVASYLGFQVTPTSRALIETWVAYARDPRILTDSDNTCGLSNFPDFRDHRHDQSILTNLVVRAGLETPGAYEGCDSKYIGVLARKLHRDSVLAAPPGPNVSRGKPASQSSLSLWSRPDDASALANEAEPGPFAFHTALEENPWWQIDLLAIMPLAEIRIFNRTDALRDRARTLCVFLSQDGVTWTEIFDGASADWDLATPLILEITGLPARFLRIALRGVQYLHLRRLEVFALEPEARLP